ncbi:MAG: FAD-dependent oxidoreductase [Pseudomonadota bacterium]
MGKRKHLIIGCGSAGISAAEEIRRLNSGDEVTLVSMEQCDPYSPLSLPYVLGRRIKESDIRLRDAKSLRRIGATIIRGRKAVRVDTGAGEVIYDRGERDRYDRLLIATGSEPLIPSLEGLEEIGFQGFHVMEDLEEITRKLQDGKEVLIYGGGLVALGLAMGLMERGCEVKIVVRSRILRGYFDEECGALITRIFEERGCQIFSGCAIKTLRRSDGQVEAVLDKGPAIRTDFPIMCVGVRPRTAFLEGSGIMVRKGVVVNKRMQTNIENVYAAGDVAESPGFLMGVSGLSPILPSAVEQGRIAGANIAGGELEYEGWIPMNSFNFFGHRAVTIGMFDAEGEKIEVLTGRDEAKQQFKKLVIEEGRLIGGSFLNIPLSAGIIRYLIREKVDVGESQKLFLEKPNEVSAWLMLRAEKRQAMPLGM